MVSTLDSGASGLGSSPGPVHCVAFLGKIFHSQCFSQKILLEGQSGPWRLVLGANVLGKRPIDNNWLKIVGKCKFLVARWRPAVVWRTRACQENNTKAYMTQSMLKGFQCIKGQFQTQLAIWKFSDVRESIQQSKRMEWLLFYVGSKDLSIWFF